MEVFTSAANASSPLRGHAVTDDNKGSRALNKVQVVGSGLAARAPYALIDFASVHHAQDKAGLIAAGFVDEGFHIASSSLALEKGQ